MILDFHLLHNVISTCPDCLLQKLLLLLDVLCAKLSGPDSDSDNDSGAV